jgi:thymidylate kinase
MLKGLIILDGPDGTGKTTLARKLCEFYNAHYLHLTRRWVNNMFEYNTAAVHHAIQLAEKQLVVIDRLWMSELVYSRAFHGGTRFPHMGRLIHRVVQKHGGIYVICLDDDISEYRERFKYLKSTRQEMYTDGDMVHVHFNDMYHGIESCGIDEIDREYEPGKDYLSDIVMNGGLKSWPCVERYRITEEGKTVVNFCERLVHRVLKRRDEQYPYALGTTQHNFLGHVADAKYLLIGDRLSTDKYRAIRWPFHYYKNCSLFLAEAMSHLQLNEGDFCWTNINESLGDEITVNMCYEMFKLKPIVMGQEAAKHYTEIAWHLPRHYYINHPQWYRRFEHNSRRLEADLRRAIAISADRE